MTKPFKLLKLPDQALRITCQLMGRMDIIPLSLCSKKTGKTLQICNAGPSGYEVKFTERKKAIIVEFDNNVKFTWEFIKVDAYHRQSSVYKVMGMDVHYIATDTGILSTSTPNITDATLFYKIFTYFVKTFPTVITELHLDLAMDKENNSGCYDNELLALLGQKPVYCQNLILSGTPVMDNLTYALEKIHVSNELTIDTNVPKNYVLPRALDSQCLIIKKGDWIMTKDCLFSLSTKYCRLECVSINEVVLKKIVQNFIKAKTIPSLEWLVVEVSGVLPSTWDVEREFQAKEWNSEQRTGYFTQFHGDKLLDIDCRLGKDIKRADGLIVTLLPEPVDSGSQRFHFIIWRKRDPNTENMKRKMKMMAHLTKGEDERNERLEKINKVIQENQKAMEGMNLAIEELKAENGTLKLNRDAFETLIACTARLQKDVPPQP